LWSGLRRSGIAEIDRMDGRTFQRRLAILFRRLGYQVEHVGRRGEYGADLIVRRDGKRTVVQARRWTKNVGVKAIQEAHTAPALYSCSGSMVVTNRYFTAAASKLACTNGVVLWDRDRLVKALLGVGDY
jgi:restriction system protein